MDRLWSPWRYRYVSTHTQKADCIFCAKSAVLAGEQAQAADRENYVLLRAERNFVLLNLYPYNNGHLMIAPYEHVASMVDASPETMAEMMRLSVRCERALREVYNPGGINLGMNLGECAGAGVAGHIHMHMLPRWPGDASFMTTVGETRVVPEELGATWEKLREALGRV